MTRIAGLLNRIVSDTQITGDEFALVEQALFADDGVVDLTEGNALQGFNSLTDPGSGVFLVFDDSEDLLRLDLLATRGIRTLDQYLEQLRTSAMTPRNDPEVLQKISEAEGMTETPVRVVSVWDGGDHYKVETITGGETFSMVHPNAVLDETGILRLAQLNNLPFDWWEVIEALREYAKGDKVSGEERKGAIDLAQILHIEFRHQSMTEPATLQTFTATTREQKLSTALSDQITYISSEAQNLPEIPLEEECLTPVYQADSPRADIADVLAALRRILPQRAIEAVRVNHTSFGFLPLSRHLRDFYNRHPEIREASFFEGFADMRATPPSIVLNQIEPVADLLYALVHELGHYFAGILRAQTFTKSAITKKVREATSDAILSAHWNSSVNTVDIPGLKDLGLSISASPTSYGVVDVEEWFAEIFAIYFLGKQSPYLEKNLSISFQKLFDDFKTRDPAGYLLMVRLDQYLSGDNRYRPEVAFSWSGLQDVRGFVDQHFSEIGMNPVNRDRMERLWRLRPPPDLKAEREYSRIVAMEKNSPDDYLAYVARLERLTHQAPFFYPATRDLWLEAVDLKMGEVLSPDLENGMWEKLSTPLSDDEIVAGIGEVLSKVPDDPIVLDSLFDLMTSACEQTTRLPYEGEPNESVDKAALMRKLGPLVRRFARERKVAGLVLLPYLLVLEGKLGEAARLVQDEESVLYAQPNWKTARIALSVSLPDTDVGKTAANLLTVARVEKRSDADFWFVIGFQGLVERLQRERRYEELVALLLKIVEVHPIFLVEVSRVLDRSVVESHLKAAPQWENIRERFVEKYYPGFALNPAVESPGFSKLYGIRWIEKDGLPHPQLAD